MDNIYACVLPLTRVVLLKFQETVRIPGLKENSGREGAIEEPSIAFARWSIFKIVSFLEYLVIFRAVFQNTVLDIWELLLNIN